MQTVRVEIRRSRSRLVQIVPAGVIAHRGVRLLLGVVWFFAVGGALAADSITRIAEVRSLAREEAAKSLPVRVRGVVTWRAGRDEFALQDDSGGTWIHVYGARSGQIWRGDDAILSRVGEGLELEIEGVTHASGYAPVIWPQTVRILDRKPLPPARPLDRERFFSGVESGQRVEAQGVILGYQAVGEGWRLRLQAGADIVTVFASRRVIPDPKSVLDAEVRIRGVGASEFNTRREFLQPRILISIPEDFVVEKPASSSASEMPIFPSNQLRAFHHEPERPHRLRIQGVVTFVVPGRFVYLQEGSSVVRVESASTVPLAPGDRVEAVGYLDMKRGIAGLGGADVRKLGLGPVPAPVAITPEQVMAINLAAVTKGQAAQPHDFDGHLIRFHAQLLAVQSATDAKLPWRRLILKQGSMTLEGILHQGGAAALDTLQPGSELEVTGLAELEFATVEGEGRSSFRPVRLALVLRSAADLAVVRAPSGWTIRRLLGLLAVGALLLGAALLWGWQMRRQVQRRTRELATEMRARRDAAIEFKATLRERNRLAANLHDTLLQTLGGLNYQLKACEAQSLPVAERKVNHLETARRMVERGQADLRGTVWALRVLPLNERKLTDALDTLAQKLGEGHPAEISVRAESELPVLSDFVAGNLLLVAQEAVHNALKHAEPPHIWVTVSAPDSGQRVVLKVQDDGAGFDTSAAAGPSVGHFGLQGMRERVERLRGRLVIESASGRGTKVRVEVPLQPFDDEIS